MQYINNERRQQNDRLQRQLPTNPIKQARKPIENKRLEHISQSAPNRFDRLANSAKHEWPLRRLQTDIDDWNTHRSLSSCPTYSSLSRASPETRECATQITTLPPIKADEAPHLSSSSSPSIDHNQVFLIEEDSSEELELMPISSGFGYYPYLYPTTRRPQIIERAPQFRDKNQYGFPSQSGPPLNGKRSSKRPTAVKHPSPRSDTYALPSKRNEVNNRTPKDDLLRRNARQGPQNQRFDRNRTPPPPPPPPPPPLPGNRRLEPMHRNNINPSTHRSRQSPIDLHDRTRKSLQFTHRTNGFDRSSSPPNHHRSTSLTRGKNDRQQHMRVANNEYVIERRRRQPEYVHDDYRTEVPSDRVRSRRHVRVLRDSPYRGYYDDDGDDDPYYVEPSSSRRPAVHRRTPQRDYVYIDEPTASGGRRSRRAEIVYLDDEPVEEYGRDYVYVDENGTEVDFRNERKPSKNYVEIADDDHDRYQRHRRRAKIIYVDDDDYDDSPRHQQRGRSKSKQPSTTKVVYD